jgi:medium-chain acyl-[acyl-carrier-protein] hydrolase
VEICPIHLPGRATRIAEQPLTSITAIIEALIPSLLPRLDRPFAFFGHSMGALISFELAHLLRREHGLSPVHLFLSGRRAPHIPGSDEPGFDLPRDEFLSLLRELKGTPEELLANAELFDLLLPMIRADFKAVQTYRHRATEPLQMPVTVFGGLEDTGTTAPQLQEWRTYTKGGFSLWMLPGDHFFVISHRRDLLQLLSGQLRLTFESCKRTGALSPASGTN